MVTNDGIWGTEKSLSLELVTHPDVAEISNSGEMWPVDKRQFQGQSLNTLQDNDALMYYITHPQGLIF